jgi:hypothetical protein
MAKNIFKVLPYSMILFTACGCDPIRTVIQEIDVQVVSATGTGLASTEIRIRTSFDSHANHSPNISDSYFKEQWEESTWTTAMTNQDGYATLQYRETGIDGNTSNTPQVDRNLLGKSIDFVIVDSEDVLQEFLDLKLQPPVYVQGENASLKILNVSPPRYEK